MPITRADGFPHPQRLRAPARGRASRVGRWMSGSVAVEFAILLPFLIMVLVGIIDVNLVLYDKAVLSNAARAGARAGTMLHVPPLTISQVAQITSANASGSLISAGSPAAPTVTVTQPGGTTPGSPLQVAISYTYSGLLLGSAFSALVGPIVLNTTFTMNYE